MKFWKQQLTTKIASSFLLLSLLTVGVVGGVGKSVDCLGETQKTHCERFSVQCSAREWETRLPLLVVVVVAVLLGLHSCRRKYSRGYTRAHRCTRAARKFCARATWYCSCCRCCCWSWKTLLLRTSLLILASIASPLR